MKTDKVDLLVVLSNSRSMGDKAGVVGLLLPDLLDDLTNPPCLDASGAVVASPGPLADCPSGSKRDHAPVRDLHVGVISSSLGGIGSDSCSDAETFSCGGAPNVSNDDHGHLLTRQDVCAGGTVATYGGKGFLAWDPAQKLSPPGEGDGAALRASANALVAGVGQIGCGFPAQNEAWYRFLVDPAPYATITTSNLAIVTQGTDSDVLAQRAEFLRDDSLVIVLNVTDHNDASIKATSQNFLVAQQKMPGNPNAAFHLPRARAECAANPADPCCASCGQTLPANCPMDAACQAMLSLTDAEDNLNLRKWDSKRRFGIDFYYPAERYVAALTGATVPDAKGNAVANPLLAKRDPSLVFYATITGVPWQVIARKNANGAPDAASGFHTPAELSGVWSGLVGNPSKWVEPTDPIMKELDAPRSGVDPITGAPMAPPSSPGANPMNGNEYSIPQFDDLEYACIFPLQTPVDCSAVAGNVSCACIGQAATANPLCAPNPNDGGNPSLQVNAKAYPGLKNLAIAGSMGVQGIVASICPAQLTDPSKPDYGYRPAARAVVDAVKLHIE